MNSCTYKNEDAINLLKPLLMMLKYKHNKTLKTVLKNFNLKINSQNGMG